ncbi:MAG: hypothetical protein CL910_07165 [Deltaproteobacteria bacterium]|jgi:SAM-dependent methyltransferase|nr:hypothetical protein [Deltaproteobacteria bacterium]
MAIEDWIRCPDCGGELRTAPREPRTGETRHFTCSGCDREIPEVDGVIDFLPGVSGPRGPLQRLMEWEPLVRIYEGKAWRSSPFFAWTAQIRLEEEISLVAHIVDAGPARTVLDLACGPGLFARRLALGESDREVVGLDVAWPMLLRASALAREQRLENLTYLHGDAHALPFREASLDAANCCGALHLFPDVRRVLGELHRVLRARGRISLGVFRRPAGLAGRLAADLGGLLGVHLFAEDELRALLVEAGFEPTVYRAQGLWMIAGGVRG